MSLRKILIVLGLLVALLPYLGFPSWINTFLYTLIGLTIVFFLTLFQKIRTYLEAAEETTAMAEQSAEAPKVLHVSRNEVEEYPEMRIEKEVTLDTEHIKETPDLDMTVEKKVTTVRTQKKSSDFMRTEEES